MEIRKKRLPIGVEDFKGIRSEDFYYVDKTQFIRDLLMNWAEVNLFTRPRRFGKSLNMSMLKCFFDLNTDKSMFNGLKISGEKELCEAYMGKFPVISISLKSIDAGDYETARAMAIKTVNEEASRMQYLLQSEKLTPYDKESFAGLLDRNMDDAAFFGSLRELTRLLHKHYGRKSVILIDEYDVPLAKAYAQGYYDQMILLIRNLFHQALKINENLKLAVLTGCMRISKESIFTGLNNLRVLSVTDVRFEEYFGFTDPEVKELLEYYELSDRYAQVKDWYDGYRFGNVEIYCPWDVLNYCDAVRADRETRPQNYWSNTSSNDVVRRFIQGADTASMKREIERLIAGETIRKEIHQELTYQDMYRSIDNLWSVLLTSGYLTCRGKPEGRNFNLAIPNMEIREIFTEQIMAFFKEEVKKNQGMAERFGAALQNGDAPEAEECFTEFLKKTISIRDTFVKKRLKENFYHGILLGILSCYDAWIVSSNREAGDGYSDILLAMGDEETGVVIEVKYAEDGNLEESCKKALLQMEANHYEEALREEGVEHILKYGIACYKKRCRVMLAGQPDEDFD